MVLDCNSADAPLYQAMVNIVKRLQTLQFPPMGNEALYTLTTDSFEIQKTGSGDGNLTQVNLPGILLTLPNQVSIPWEGGTNKTMEPTYPILLQIIDRDSSRKVEGLRTYLKWQNQIVRCLSQPDLILIDPETEGVSYEISQCTAVYSLDERKWRQHQMFQCGIIVELMTQETWGED